MWEENVGFCGRYGNGDYGCVSVCYTVSSVDSEKEQARRFVMERFPVYGLNVGLSQKKEDG